MKSVLRICLFVFITSLVSITSSAQVQTPTVSATALSYGKYADIPVSKHTGTGNIVVPICTVSDGPLSVPVTLQYHTGGLQVASHASPVGLGWNLNAGGMITRTVRDEPDDYQNTGYYEKGDEVRIPTDQNSPSWDWDSEPDIYTYSFGGYTGKFTIDGSRQVHFMPDADLQVEFIRSNLSSTNYQFTSIVITTPNGVRYIFGGIPGSNNWMNHEYFELFDHNTNNYIFNPYKSLVGWHLTRIETADRLHQIDFQYQRMSYEYVIPSVCPVDGKYRNNNGNIQSFGCGDPEQKYYSRSNVLVGITTTQQTVNFGLADRNDLDGLDDHDPTAPPKRISHIELQDGSTCVRWDLFHSYFSSGSTAIPNPVIQQRLKLDQVQKRSCSGSTTEPAWEFDYLGSQTPTGEIFFPATFDKNVDHWGYYNYDQSKGGNTDDLTPATSILLNCCVTTYGTANRNSFESAMLKGMLNRVTFPTGGHTELEYEANSYAEPVETITAFEVESCSTNNCTNTQYQEANFTYTSSLAVHDDLRWEFCSYSGGSNSGSNGIRFARVEVFTLSGTEIATYEFNGAGAGYCTGGDMPTVGSPAHNSPMIVGQTYRIRVTSSNNQAIFRIVYGQHTNTIAGGLRLKKVTTHDGISSSRDIVKNYKYEVASTPGSSSGKLFRTPNYVSRINENTALFFAHAYAPLSGLHGGHLSYERVEVSTDGAGKEITDFHRAYSAGPAFPFPAPPDPLDAELGTPQTITLHGESGQTVSSTFIDREDAPLYQNIGGSASQGYYFAKAITKKYVSNIGLLADIKLFEPYTHRTGVYRPGTVTSTIDGITTVTEYEYTDDDNLLADAVVTTNSNGDVYRNETIYQTDDDHWEIRLKTNEANMVQVPYQNKQYVNGELVDVKTNYFKFFRADGTSPSYSYNGRIEVPRPWRNQITTYTYDATGTLQYDGAEVVQDIQAYTPSGLPKTFNRPDWGNTTVIYDAQKRLSSKTFGTHTTSYTYDGGGSRLLSITRVDGTTSSYTYDGLGRLKTASDDCKNIVKAYTYGFRWGGQNVNYVETDIDYPSPDSRSQFDGVISRQYTDGLGRSIVHVNRNVGPNSNDDIITGVDYDKHGRIARTYEPYARPNNYGNYRSTSTTRDHTAHNYDDTPLGRVISVTPPEWAATNYSYSANGTGDFVKQDGTSNYYPIGSLSKRTTIDGNGNKLIVFSDKLGQRVLSRRTDGGDTHSKRLDTYYLHDGKGRIAKVLPPGATINSHNLYYSYLYDGKGNVTRSKVPGAQAVNFKYNDRELMAAYQDGNLSGQGEWYAYNFDSYGRPTTEGFYAGSFSGDFDQLNLSEPLVTTTYGQNSWDRDKVKTSSAKIMDGGSDWLEFSNTYNSCGNLTTQTSNNHRNLSPTETTTYSYDGAGNLTYSSYQHKFPGNNRTIVSEHHYDYAGRNSANHFDPGSGGSKQINSFKYDHRNNVSTKSQGRTHLSTQHLQFLQEINYSYLTNGMLEGINLNGTSPLSGTQVALPGYYQHGTTPSGTAGNNYDDKDLFQLQLYRDVAAPGTAFPVRQNGDLTSVVTQVKGRMQQLWNLDYDEYDRMTNARFYERASAGATASSRHHYKVDVAYDGLGNIETLDRDGLNEVSANLFHWFAIDQLNYNYPASGSNTTDNRLSSISEQSTAAYGYPSGGTGSYTYDDNGNTTYDPSRNVSITYNHLNLPTEIRWNSGSNQQRLEMTYDATGTLLNRRKISSTGTLLETRDFVGGVEYVNDGLESIAHEEGRVYFGGGSPQWQYALTDHLGNTRVLYADLNNDGIPQVPAEILQEEHYYPFGMKMVGPWMGASSGGKTDYQYNGIEYVDDFELGVNMAMYRTLDPSTGRWWSVDPKAELTKNWSPYNSMGNSPMVHTDPNGDVLPAVLVGAIIGAAISGGTTMATNAIAGNNVFRGVGSAMLLGAAGGAIGAGFNGIFTTAFGQSAGTSILSNVASTAATSVTFGQDITLGTLSGGVAGGLVRGAMPGFTGVKGGALSNIGAELIHSAGVGAYAGAIGGAVSAAADGRDIGSGFGNGALYGAIGGAVQATLNVAVMGPAYVPERTYGFFEDGKQPVYRSGGLTWLSGRGSGIALGRNLVTHQYKDKLSDDNQHLRAHETAHFIQMGANGFGKFYSGTASQYAKYGINWRNPNNVYNQPTSYEYAADRYADQWFKLWP